MVAATSRLAEHKISGAMPKTRLGLPGGAWGDTPAVWVMTQTAGRLPRTALGYALRDLVKSIERLGLPKELLVFTLAAAAAAAASVKGSRCAHGAMVGEPARLLWTPIGPTINPD